MKFHLLAVGILSAASTVAYSQVPAERPLFDRLVEGPDRVEALETVLKHPEKYPAPTLFTAAGVAFTEDRLEDSAFLLYAGQLRVAFDKECFPPKGTGGSSPFLVTTVLYQQFGRDIIPAVMAKPKVFSKVIARLKKWTPKAPNEYHPGYDFTERKSEEEAIDATEPHRTRNIAAMEGLGALLNDAEYFAAFRVVQAYTLDGDEQKPTQEAYEQAAKTMRRIEKDRGIEGVISIMGDRLPPN